MSDKRLTVRDIVEMKAAGEKIIMLTAYDASFGRLLDQCGVEVVLVGDSLGMVALGYDSTVPVTMDEMVHHARAVRHGVKRAVLVGDMPFLSYQVEKSQAIANAGRFMKEAGCDAVKLEGGLEVCDTVAAMVRAGIPVMGHIGLTPQTAGSLGGYKVQGRDAESASRILAEAKGLAEAGAFAVVLECIPDKLAAVITSSIDIPTIGIGASARCDGQVLVTHDLLGMFDRFVPRFVKQYANLASQMREAVAAFRDEAKAGIYPGQEHSFTMQLDPAVLTGKGKRKAAR
ncbi:MAG: 3-methyl-2-oxobutanoate hydroxymethyltransferase [Thermodesulfobacteriota bacterium]